MHDFHRLLHENDRLKTENQILKQENHVKKVKVKVKKKRYHHHGRNWLIGIGSVVMLGLLVGVVLILGDFFRTYTPAHQSRVRDAQAVLRQRRPVSILLMGIDTGSEGRHYKGRTDTLMLDTFNPQNHRATLTSIPRDSYVHYRGNPVKINSIYTYGGSSSVTQFVQNWLHVPVDYYVKSNMHGLIQVVNRIHGISLTPLQTFSNNGTHFKKGRLQFLTGRQTLNYVQMRYQDPHGDYGRQMRNRQVLISLLKQIGNMNVSDLKPGVIRALSKNIKTDLTFDDLLQLALSYRNQSVKATYLQGTNAQIGGYDYQRISRHQLKRGHRFIARNLDLNR